MNEGARQADEQVELRALLALKIVSGVGTPADVERLRLLAANEAPSPLAG